MANTEVNTLRSIAIGLVILYHLQVPGFEIGFLGVDIFLILSGYLMARSVQRSSASDFIINRVKRLFPPLLTTIFFTTIASLLITTQSDTNQLLSRNFFHVAGLSNLAFWNEASYFDNYQYKPLLNLWSLSLELQFYLVTPLCYALYRRHPHAFWVLIICSFVSMLLMTSVSPKTSFFLTPFRIWEYLLGLHIAHLAIPIKRPPRILKMLLYFSLLAYVVAVPIVPSVNSLYVGHPGISTLPLILIVGYILLISRWKEYHNYRFCDKIFLKVADYSYPLYLTHFPVIVFVNHVDFSGTKLGFQNIADLTLIIAITLIASHILVLVFEKKRERPIFENSFFPVALFLFFIASAPHFSRFYTDDREYLIHRAWADRSAYRCGKLFRLINPTSKLCRVSSGNMNMNVILLGNSHADSIKATFSSAMSTLGLNVYFYVANDPLMSDQHSSTTVSKSINLVGANAVVLHFNADFYAKTTNLIHLKTFIAEMHQLAVPIILILPVPEFDFHVPQHLLSRLGETSETQEIYASDLRRPHMAFALSDIDDGLTSHITIVNPRSVFCKEHGCLIQDSRGQPLYFDSEHLTESGAKILNDTFFDLGLTLLRHKSIDISRT